MDSFLTTTRSAEGEGSVAKERPYLPVDWRLREDLNIARATVLVHRGWPSMSGVGVGGCRKGLLIGKPQLAGRQREAISFRKHF